MSLPEVLLWQALRARPNGLKFRWQHPAGKYCLDFYCDRARLCIEIDGEAHERGDAPAHDEARDAWMQTQGVRTLRLPAALVLSDMNAAIAAIRDAAKSSP